MTISKIARKRLVLADLSLSAFVAYLDFAIVNTALPSIQRDLTLTFVQPQWVMNIFVLTLCIFMGFVRHLRRAIFIDSDPLFDPSAGGLNWNQTLHRAHPCGNRCSLRGRQINSRSFAVHATEGALL